MRMTGVAAPFTSYTIPPSAPGPVVEAWKELNRIGILYEDVSDDLKAAQQAAGLDQPRGTDTAGCHAG